MCVCLSLCLTCKLVKITRALNARHNKPHQPQLTICLFIFILRGESLLHVLVNGVRMKHHRLVLSAQCSTRLMSSPWHNNVQPQNTTEKHNGHCSNIDRIVPSFVISYLLMQRCVPSDRSTRARRFVVILCEIGTRRDPVREEERELRTKRIKHNVNKMCRCVCNCSKSQ